MTAQVRDQAKLFYVVLLKLYSMPNTFYKLVQFKLFSPEFFKSGVAPTPTLLPHQKKKRGAEEFTFGIIEAYFVLNLRCLSVDNIVPGNSFQIVSKLMSCLLSLMGNATSWMFQGLEGQLRSDLFSPGR